MRARPVRLAPRSTYGAKPSMDWAEALLQQIRAMRLQPLPIREYSFDPKRKWRMDLAWPEYLFFAECDGGEWTQGRHSRGKGMQADCEKWNAATLDGWQGFRFTGSQVKSGYAVGILQLVLRQGR